MSDDGNAARHQHLITARVIEMIVTVDCVLDREFGERLNLGNQFFDGRGSKESIEDQNAIIANDKSGIARSEPPGLAIAAYTPSATLTI